MRNGDTEGAAGTSGTTGTSTTGTAGNSSSAGTTGTTGTTGTVPFTPDPGCRTTADCANGQTCVRFGSDGPGACATPAEPVTECTVPNPANDCCNDSECPSGACFTIVTQPVECSSTAGYDALNRCLTDECTSDSDCTAGELCTPAGYSEARFCVTAGCRSDADCTAEPGGVCEFLDLGCCALQIGGAPFRPPALACAYPSDGCHTDNDCAEGHCVVTDGRAQCSAECP